MSSAYVTVTLPGNRSVAEILTAGSIACRFGLPLVASKQWTHMDRGYTRVNQETTDCVDPFGMSLGTLMG